MLYFSRVFKVINTRLVIVLLNSKVCMDFLRILTFKTCTHRTIWTFILIFLCISRSRFKIWEIDQHIRYIHHKILLYAQDRSSYWQSLHKFLEIHRNRQSEERKKQFTRARSTCVKWCRPITTSKPQTAKAAWI